MADILMNKEQIMEIIPHRDPFLLIDEIRIRDCFFLLWVCRGEFGFRGVLLLFIRHFNKFRICNAIISALCGKCISILSEI